jgi:hypothetical protein
MAAGKAAEASLSKNLITHNFWDSDLFSNTFNELNFHTFDVLEFDAAVPSLCFYLQKY